MTKIWDTKPNAGKDMEEWELLFTVDGNVT